MVAEVPSKVAINSVLDSKSKASKNATTSGRLSSNGNVYVSSNVRRLAASSAGDDTIPVASKPDSRRNPSSPITVSSPLPPPPPSCSNASTPCEIFVATTTVSSSTPETNSFRSLVRDAHIVLIPACATRGRIYDDKWVVL